MSAPATTTTRRSIGWMGLKRGHRARPLEWVAEKFIFLVSLSAIVVVFLIFLFVAREALPIFLGQMNSSLAGEVIPVEKMSTMSDKELMAYLDLTPSEFRQMDKEGLQASDGSKGGNKEGNVDRQGCRYKYDTVALHAVSLSMERLPGA
jgi:hypothetical protein